MPSGATQYKYDNAGNLKLIDYPSGTHDVHFERDAAGNTLSIRQGSVTQRYNYNSMHLAEDEQLYIEGETPLFLDYEYNKSGYLESLVYPDGSVVKYALSGTGSPKSINIYDQQGKLEQAVIKNIYYHANGIPRQFEYANGVKYDLSLHTDIGLPKGLSYKQGSRALVSYQYGYNDQHNIQSIKDYVDGRFTISGMNYDSEGRLTYARGGSALGNIDVDYDYLGNISHYSSSRRNLNYTYASNNRLSKVTGVSGRYGSFRYDSRGNTLYNGAYNMTYDAAGRMITANGTSFVYDGHGKRVKTTANGKESFSFYNAHGRLVFSEKGSLDGAGTNYVYFDNLLVAKYGSVDLTKVKSGVKRHMPFGEPLNSQEDEVGYTGHMYDKSLGLNYAQARYYDPVIGRFYSNDPVDAAGHLGIGNIVQGFNRFSYANNNPYKFTDPDGELPLWVGAGLGAAAINYGQQVAKNLASQEMSFSDAIYGEVKFTEVAVEGLVGAVGANGAKMLATAISGANSVGKIDSVGARISMGVTGAAQTGYAGAIKGGLTEEDPLTTAVKNVIDTASPVPVADQLHEWLRELW